MKDKIWLVFKGEYADCHTMGAFSSREKAEAYMDALKSVERDPLYIEELPMDPPAPPVGPETEITMWKDGAYTILGTRIVVSPTTKALKGGYGLRRPMYRRNFVVATDNEGRAVAVADELRKTMLKDGTWEDE